MRSVEIDGETVSPDNYEFLNIENFACPACGAPDKARLIAWFMKTEGFARLRSNGSPLLHFDPEAGMVPMLSGTGIEYIPTSWPERRYRDSYDITDLREVYAKIGGFICSHILEHVETDSIAVNQLFRALVPGGFGIVLVPIISKLEKNWEVEGNLSEDERWRFFGQGDHVRIYSRIGLGSLLEGAGFEVRELGEEHFGGGVFKELALTRSSTLYVVEKKSDSQ